MDVDNQNSDEELKIVVRKNEYYVSKKFICSVVPYFEKMFCGNMLQSKENKVVLDFDEHVFDSILNWVHTGSFLIQMEDIINFYEAADYLMINERLLQPCLNYFHSNFAIKHLPVVLSQVIKASKLINLEAIEYFICRHFLEIVNTKIFLNYPSKTVEHILKLDLMIYSEYQVFETIMKWVNKKVESRKKSLPRLLNCVRWSFMDPVHLAKIKDNELVKTLPNLDSIISSNCECAFNRSKQNFFVSIHDLGDLKLRINVYDNDLLCLPIGDFTQDDSISLDFIHSENISDILFESGRKGIRIDWIKKTFRWLEFDRYDKRHYSQLFKTIVHFMKQSRSVTRYLEEKNTIPAARSGYDEYVLLESVGNYILIGKTEYTDKWFGIFPVTHPSWFNTYRSYGETFLATVLDKTVYILTDELEFIQFNYETCSFDKSEPFEGQEWDFGDLILTCHQTNDDKILLTNQSSGKIFVYLINQKKWIEKYRIMNVNVCSNNSRVHSNELIGFTSTFLRMKNIKPVYRRNFRLQ